MVLFQICGKRCTWLSVFQNVMVSLQGNELLASNHDQKIIIILVTHFHAVLLMSVLKFGGKTRQYILVDDFLYSHHLPTFYYIENDRKF